MIKFWGIAGDFRGFREIAGDCGRLRGIAVFSSTALTYLFLFAPYGA